MMSTSKTLLRRLFETMIDGRTKHVELYIERYFEAHGLPRSRRQRTPTDR